MNPTEFAHWCQTLCLDSKTIELIERIRTTPPTRRVQGRAGNVSGTYPSSKMGATIQFESHRVELWAIYQMEHCGEVLEFYDQPEGFKIRYKNAAGRNIGHYHTPDFFVLRTGNAGWEEWKTETQLIKLSEKYPTRYQKEQDGQWRCPPGETYASQLGLKYYVRSDADLDRIYIQNLMFLEDYLKGSVSINDSFATQVKKIVTENPAISLSSIKDSIKGIRANDLYAMIALEQLYVDLSECPLVDQKSVHLYADKATHDAVSIIKQVLPPQKTAGREVEPNTVIKWDGRVWRLLNPGQKTITLLPEIGQPIQINRDFWESLLETGQINFLTEKESSLTAQEIQTLMSEAGREDLEVANKRFHLVQAYLSGQPEEYKHVSRRTLQRWSKKFQEATDKYGCGYVGLLPQRKKQGNRNAKAPPASRELLETFITTHFDTPRQAPAASVYRAYKKACIEQNLIPLSHSTFYKRISSRRTPEQLSQRYGATIAYNQSSWYWELNASTPPHGDRPLSVCHLDHTQLDIELRSSTTGRLLGRPWLTLLTDAYSRRILAVYLTFDPPSYRSCMMALRICVGRTGRFPSTLVVDGGKEFHSVYFDSLLARYYCTKKTRPSKKPRFGSVIERLFNTTNTQFVYNLLGNTQASKQPRTLTKDINPKGQAVWTLGDLYTYLQQWAYELYDTTEHPALFTTPLLAYEQGLILTGEREHRHIAYDEDFILATLPSSRTGVAQVQPGRGIKLHYLYYWSEAFRNPALNRTKVSIRYDPMDVGVAYAYVQGRWVKCISQYYSIFKSRSEKELFLASVEIKQLKKLTNISIPLSAQRLAEFLSNAQKYETILMQRLRDLEAKMLLDSLLTESPTEQETTMPISNPTSSSIPVSPKQLKVLANQTTRPVSLSVDVSQLPILEEYR